MNGMMVNHWWRVGLFVLLVGGAALAGDKVAEGPAPSLRDDEIRLAESAGPPALAREATIYVLEDKGYVVARAGTNGFACLVGHDRPDTQEPMCFDPEGSETILPAVLERARLRATGLGEAEIEAAIGEGFRNGKYRAPRRPGVTYMLSTENRVFTGEEVISYPPHVMFFAPYLKNSDIGADMANRWMPWVLEEGSPHAYIIMVVGGEPQTRGSD